MKLRMAFILSLLSVLVVMAVPAILGVQYVREVRTIALDLRERTAEAAFIVGRVQSGLERLDRYQRTYVATGGPELARLANGAANGVADDLGRLRATGYGEAVDEASLPLPAHAAVWRQVRQHMEEGRANEATELLNLELTPLMAELTESTQALAGAVDNVTATRLGSVDEITGRAVTVTTLSLLAALWVAAILTLLTARFLTRPLNQLSAAMARVADGDLHTPEELPYGRRDEIGELFRTFRSMALRLGDLDRMKAQFVGMASHDLKTPINVLKGYAELLAQELGPTSDERHRSILDSMERQAHTLGTRLNQLLEISRIEAGGLRLGLEEINLRHYTTELARAHSAGGRRHSIEIEATVDDSAPTFLIADPDTLRTEVFGNLLDNALKFSPRGGRIHLRVSGHGGTITFEIADQGPGIPPEVIPHAFDRYFRGRDPSGRLGTGLSLPLARAGVEAHGGTVEVEAPPAGGTVFRVTLPIHPTVHVQEPTPQPQEA